jgi:hypothetical protein
MFSSSWATRGVISGFGRQQVFVAAQAGQDSILWAGARGPTISTIFHGGAHGGQALDPGRNVRSRAAAGPRRELMMYTAARETGAG